MKIIHVNFSDVSGGAARAAYRIHNSLIKKNIDSEMWVNKANSDDWTIKEPPNKFEKLYNEIKTRLVNYSIVKMLKTGNKIIHSPSILPSKWVKKINDSNVDLVHLHWIQNEMISIKDISKIKKPIVWTLHDMWAFCGAEHYTNDNRWIEGYYPQNRPNYEAGFDLNKWTWNRKKKYWKNPIQIITPSNWLARSVKKSKLMSNWPVSVIPNPIDTNFWMPSDKKIARKQLNLPSDIPLLLFGAIGGSNDSRKGYDLLIDALKYLKADPIASKLEIVIFGQSKQESKQEITFPIHYMGHLNNDVTLKTIYTASDVMIVPSRQDNLPNTAIEAQACGTPVVSFDIGGLSDIIQHKKTGYLAKAFDTKDLAQGILFILHNFQSTQLNKNSHQNSVLNFNEKKIAESYIGTYQMLLK